MRRSVDIDYLKAGLEKPIPGESLTQDPENPMPWEKPPQFTTVKEACGYLFEQLTQEENYMQLMTLAGQGMPLINIAKVLLTAGFQEGKWNPDLLMILVEPLVYMMAALLERADIDFIIEHDEDNNPDEEEADDYDALRQLQRKSSLVPEEIESRLQETPVPEEEPMPLIEEEQPSLLGERRP